MCPTIINWVKVSEIVFDALLTGIISAGTIIIAYWLGKRQADISWKREDARREKEKKEQDSKALTKERINILTGLIDLGTLCKSRASYYNFHHGYHFLTAEEIDDIVAKTAIASGLFQGKDNLDVMDALQKLIEMAYWPFKVSDNEAQAVKEAEYRASFVENIFQTFIKKLFELVKTLNPS